MSSLKAATAACLQDFALLFGQLQQHDELRDKLEEMQEENGRLKVWAGNLGALASGHSALDWRLRDSSVMRTSVLMLLRELQTLLQTSSDIVSGGAQSTNQDPDGTEFDFDSISLPSDEEGEGDTTNDLDDTFTSIIETVKNLYKLSFRIRNPNSRTKTSKASLYKEVSNDTGRDLFGDHFASFDRLHIVELLASFRNRALSELSANDEVLVSLLTRSNTTRRRQFRYWSKHGQKLATESQASDYSPAFVHDAHDKYLMTPLVNPGPLLHLAGPKAPSNIEKSIGTTTEATVFDPKLDLSNLETQSNISFATTAKDLDGRVAELPHPPSAATNGQDFVCPYCFVLCPSRHGHSRAWRAHIVQDLQPYLCTYQDCTEGNRLYGSRQAWLDHEGRVHRKLWRCRDHPDLDFKTQPSLEQHLRTKHADIMSERQISDYAEISETMYEDDREQCPFCLQDACNIPNFANHLANHMERIATFSLPRYVDNDRDSTVGSDRAMSHDASSGMSWESGTIDFSETSEIDASSDYELSQMMRKNRLEVLDHDMVNSNGSVRPQSQASSSNRSLTDSHDEPMEGHSGLKDVTGRLSRKTLSLACEDTIEVLNSLIFRTAKLSKDDKDMLTRHEHLLELFEVLLQLPGRAQDMQIAPAQFAAMTDILAEMREYCNQLVELIDRHAGDNTQPASGIQPQYISRQRVMENYQIDEWLSDVQGQGTALSALLTVIESGSSDVPDLPPGTAALAVSHQEVKDDSLLNESTSIGYDDRIVNLIRARLRKEMGNNNRSGRKGSTVRQVSALGRLIEDDPQLTERIVEHIADTVEDSSLLAKMILDYLVSLGTSRAITTALRDMPHTLNAIYEDSIQKHVMGSSLQNIGMKALAALSCAYREITMSELRHIIAFQVDHGSNSVYTTMGGNLGGDIIKSTRGLVIEDSRHMLKFFHPTFQNYMRNTTKWFPNAHAELACACLRYLGSERFAHSCGDRGYFNLEISSTLFATYAPLFWAKHIQDAASYEGVAQSVEEYMGNALKFTSGVQAAVWLGSETFDVVHGLDALHVCASLNLRHHTNRLIDQGARINIGEPTYSQTPLMYASRAGHHSLVCSLLDSGANVNLVSAKGKTALCEAIEHNHVEIVEEILRRPELDINSVRDTLHNLNALMVACDTGNLDIIQALLKHPKIDVNKLDSGGQSALVRVVNKGRECNYEVLELLLLSDRRIDTKWHDSQGRGLVTLAVLAEDYKMLETLLSHGTDGNSVDVRGRPAIYFAAEKGDLTAFSTLVAHGISARFENPLGQGLLHVAAAGGHPHMVLNMLSIGLNIDAQDFTGATSLHVTCRSDHRATAELLVKEKANTTLQDSWGRDAFTVARQYGHMWIMRLLKPESIMQSGDRLIMMTYEGLPAWSLLKLGLFQRFMEHFAKDPTWAIELEPYTNNTTMHWAVISGSSMVLDRLLIHPGLSPEAVNDQGRTPLHLAAVVDQPDLAFRLIKKLGQVSTKDFSGKTPLHCACEANSFRTAIILLEFGASVDVPDLPRSKLMFWALREKKLQAIKRLLPTDPYELYAEDENGKTIAEVAAECGLTEYVLTMMGL